MISKIVNYEFHTNRLCSNYWNISFTDIHLKTFVKCITQETGTAYETLGFFNCLWSVSEQSMKSTHIPSVVNIVTVLFSDTHCHLWRPLSNIELKAEKETGHT